MLPGHVFLLYGAIWNPQPWHNSLQGYKTLNSQGTSLSTIRWHRGNLATELVLLVWISIHDRTHLLCSSVPRLGQPLTTRTGIHFIMRPIPSELLPPSITFPFFLDHSTPLLCFQHSIIYDSIFPKVKIMKMQRVELTYWCSLHSKVAALRNE